MWREVHTISGIITITRGEWTQLGNPNSQLWIERDPVGARLSADRSPAERTTLT